MAIKLDTTTLMWISDRIDNREPLFYNEFITLMDDLGYDITTYLKKSYKKAAKAAYKKYKKELFN